ncbi:MAG: hypothetical protein SAK29_26330 [Scytonema sp. PMC 1069.18]|nr:hypothetical protein [Scytonema sp. PMC 1069.18]MEC4884740.1 hypothetical protein [Scytonema sp. PMC 1070.18]
MLEFVMSAIATFSLLLLVALDSIEAAFVSAVFRGVQLRCERLGICNIEHNCVRSLQNSPVHISTVTVPNPC